MIHKIQHGIELGFVFIAIKFQPIVGIISGIIAGVYYLSMLKLNVVDKKFNGSWKEYLKSIINVGKDKQG